MLLGTQQKEMTMTQWNVQTGIKQFKTVEADRYVRDGDWIHFYDAEDKQVGSYVAISVEKKA